MSYYYIFKEENLTAEQNQRLYDLVMELGPRNDVSYAEHIAEIKAKTVIEFAKEYGGKFSGLPDFASSAVSLFADQYANKIHSGEIK